MTFQAWQSMLNRFVLPRSEGRVSVREFGAYGDGVADDTGPVQAAITKAISIGAALHVPSGAYRITTGLTALTTSASTQGLVMIGDGMTTRFMNEVANGTLLTIYQASASHFNYGVRLENFAIETATSPASSHGIDIGATIGANIQRVYITGLSGDCIRVKQLLGDADMCTNVHIQDCRLYTSGGWAINTNLGASMASISSWVIRRNYVSACSGGFRLAGYNGVVTDNTIGLSATNPDIEFYYNGVTPNGWKLRNNWFEKGRVGGVLFSAGVNCDFKQNHFIYNDASSGAYGFRVGHAVTATALGNSFSRNRWIVTGPAAFTAYDLLETADNNRIEFDSFETFGGGYTKYSMGTSDGNVIIDNAGDLLGQRKTQCNKTKSTTAASPYTPTLLEGNFQRIVLDTTGAWTINVPSNGADAGREMVLLIFNTSGGAVTVTFGAGFAVSTWANPANGMRKTGRFIYDSSSTAWVQVGDWSSDF